MPKYVTRLLVSDDIDWVDRETPPTMDVHPADDEPVFTGLVDASGCKIYRVRERVACGFPRS